MQNYIKGALILSAWLVIPNWVQAAVFISEIAWMGTTLSANHEWIELRNTGNQVDLAGWTLEADSGLLINLEGTIPADSYIVLERTSDASAPGAAHQLYTGALNNSGATLTLRDAGGGTVDRVSGGENWENIGGDNATKDTAQRQGSVWVTAAATPGAAIEPNSIAPTETVAGGDDESVAAVSDTNEGTAVTSRTQHSRTQSDTLSLSLPDITLELDITGPHYVHLSEPAMFSVTPAAVGDSIARSLRYYWTWGDGTATHSTSSASHTYQYPGTYVVVVEAKYKRQIAQARFSVTVIEPMMTLSWIDYRTLQLENNGPREIDLGRYQLFGEQAFHFPEYTILPAGGTLRLASQKVNRLRGEADVRLLTETGAFLTSTDHATVQAQLLAGQSAQSATLTVANNTASPILSPLYLTSLTPTLVSERPSADSPVAAAPTAQLSATNTLRTLPAIAAIATPTPESLLMATETPVRLWPTYALMGIVIAIVIGMVLLPGHNESDKFR
jgi:hypothetical protein